MEAEIIILLVKVFVVFNIIMGLASLCTWFERKGSALIQDRIGANRAGRFFETDILVLKPVFWVVRWLGILGVINTLLCDAVKALTKEDFVPDGVSQVMHCMGPFLAVLPVFTAFALLPLAPEFVVWGYRINPQLAPIDGGILFFLAMGSLAVYGVALAGWTSSNKFALLGSLRASAQMISYELSMGIALVSVILLYGTLDLAGMVAQQGTVWGVFYAPVAFVIFFVAGMAETKRAPFDLPEAESELVAGYFTEYSGMKFLLFWLGEFAEIALLSLIMVLVFLGGWNLPFLELPVGTWYGALIGHIILMTKVIAVCFLQVIIRWTLPRFRYDQLMTLGWKILLPLSLVNLVVTAAIKLSGGH